MKFGVMFDFRNPDPWRRPDPAFYRAQLDEIVRLDELGYDDRTSLCQRRLQSRRTPGRRGNCRAYQPYPDWYFRPVNAVSRFGARRGGVNTGVKVHQRTAVKIHQREEDGGVWFWKGEREGDYPLAVSLKI